MSPLVLEGVTLRERQRYYNNLLQKALDEKHPKKLEAINYNDNDIDNILKIDIACRKRNIDYILEVLKCQDITYVCRTLKQCKWLITEKQYEYIINTQYLQAQLFPFMTIKATDKLLLYIRLNLTDEERVKEFYSYYNEINPKDSFKWLLNCPIDFMLEAVRKRGQHMPLYIFKRLCKRSPDVLKIYIDKQYSDYIILSNARLLLKQHTEKYLDVVDSTWNPGVPHFNAKCTRLFLKKCPERILNNFGKYATRIHLPTFVSYIRRSGVKNYLLAQANDGIPSWFEFNELKYFLFEIPRQEITDLLKTLFKINDEEITISELYYAIETNHSVPANVYRWYEVAPFNVAKIELPKLIYSESSPEKRQSILTVFLNCASQNPKYIKEVLQYYHDKHINEPYKNKIAFVKNVLQLFDTYRFDKETWNLLNNLFHSLEVYTESDNRVMQCVDSIILYKVLHDEKVPEIIEEKFKFKSFKHIQHKLSEIEKEMMFTYLYNYLISKLQKHKGTSETNLNEIVSIISDLWKSLKDWKKEEQYYIIVIEAITEILIITERKTCKMDLSNMYNMLGPWRRYLLKESLSLCASDEACVNVLRHEPQLLMNFRTKVDAYHNSKPPHRLLTILRRYYGDTLAKQWSDEYLLNMREDRNNNKVSVQSLLILLYPRKLIDFIDTHSPPEVKINWDKIDETEIDLRRNIATNLHLAKPALPIDTILKYARGDYLQYTQHSLCLIYKNLSPNDFRKQISKLLFAPVALQKHGIRLAFNRLNTAELIETFSYIWKSTKNKKVRALLFTLSHDLLCKEKAPSLIEEIWETLNTYMDQLTLDENTEIYSSLANIEQIPINVRAKFYEKSYVILKFLPDNRNNTKMLNDVTEYAKEIMEYLDPIFVTDVLLETAYDTFIEGKYSTLRNISAFLLCSTDESNQTQRYIKLLRPILKRCIITQQSTTKKFNARGNIISLLNILCRDIINYVFAKNMVIPDLMFSKIYYALEKISKIQEDYTSLTSWKLTVSFIKLWNDLSSKNRSWDYVMHKSVPYLGKLFKKQLKKDILKHFPLIYLMFKDSCDIFLQRFNIHDDMIIMTIIEYMLQKDVEQTYLVGLSMLPNYLWAPEKIAKKNQLCKKIYAHPSMEVKMHYLHIYDEVPDIAEEDEELSSDTEDSVLSDSSSVCSLEDSSEEESVDDSEEQNISDEVPHRWCSLL